MLEFPWLRRVDCVCTEAGFIDHTAPPFQVGAPACSACVCADTAGPEVCVRVCSPHPYSNEEPGVTSRQWDRIPSPASGVVV